MEETIIRKFKPEDRQAVRDIAWETAFLGESAEAFFHGKEILADFLTLYFTDYEPDSCFVAVRANRVEGYLIGSTNCRKLALTFMSKILCGLLIKLIFSGAIFRGKNLRMIFAFLLSFLKGEFSMKEIKEDYPATLHINLRKDSRGQGAGSRLISAFEEYLKVKNVLGVYLATMSSASGDFFRKQGFSLSDQYRRSYFRHVSGQDIIVYIYVKKL
jgi:GNAT superfamily N-acetyltransferase